MIRDLQQENIKENCYKIIIKDLKTGKKIWTAITEQITTDQKFVPELGQDVMTLKVLLSDEYVEENSDKEFCGEIEEE